MRGTLIQEHGRVASHAITVGCFGQKAVDHQKVAEDACTAGRCVASGRNVFGYLLALRDSCEQAKLDGGFQCLGLVKSVHCLEK